MSELEKLNNKKLSKMCQKCGTPNVPVTQTTRKVVIKRLEVSITDKQYSGKNANHRANARPYARPFRRRYDTSSSGANIGSFSQPTSALEEKYPIKWPLLAQPPSQDYYEIVIGPQISLQQVTSTAHNS
uniref:LEM domain-containing protein n=1 Tax=Glossina pallidipes TaxID=7398 RepID=A0A1B0ABL8_GLOPL